MLTATANINSPVLLAEVDLIFKSINRLILKRRKKLNKKDAGLSDEQANEAAGSGLPVQKTRRSRISERNGTGAMLSVQRAKKRKPTE